MKLKLFLAAVLTLPAMAFASDFPWLTFLMSDNTELSVASDNLEINYSEGNLQLTSSVVNQSIPVDKIKTMRFTMLSSAIDDVIDNTTCPADYYTVSGIKVGRFESPDEARQALPSGIYIGKSELKTYKIIF